jgi:hypothetical protein
MPRNMPVFSRNYGYSPPAGSTLGPQGNNTSGSGGADNLRTHEENFTGQTSVTIGAVTHGMNFLYSITVVDSAGNVVVPNTANFNATTKDVTVTFGVATSGIIKLVGSI